MEQKKCWTVHSGVAGLSWDEYTAIVAATVLSFANGLNLVQLRQQLLMVDIFEKDIDLPWYPDEIIGRTTIQLADDKCRKMASYEVGRGHDLEGTLVDLVNYLEFLACFPAGG